MLNRIAALRDVVNKLEEDAQSQEAALVQEMESRVALAVQEKNALIEGILAVLPPSSVAFDPQNVPAYVEAVFQEALDNARRAAGATASTDKPRD